MPALQLFNRRWLLAGDDVPGPAIVLATFHFVWVCLLAAWLGEIHGPEDCKGVGPYYVAVGGLLASFSLSCALEIAAAAVGLRGSIFETKRRAALPRIIYANAASVFAQIAFNSYATYLLVRRPPQCTGAGGKPWDPVDVLNGLVWSTWAVIVGLAALVVAVFNLFPNYWDEKSWERQCQCLAGWGPCLTRRARGALRGAASRRLGALFSLMFSHIDLTPSDIAAAFGLALAKQRLRRRVMADAARRRHRDVSPGSDDGLLSISSNHDDVLTSSNHDDAMERGEIPSSSSRPVIDGIESNGSVAMGGAVAAPPPAAWELGHVEAEALEEAAHYMRYAFASYGWMLFVWDRQAAGVAQLCCGRGCGMWAAVAARRHGGPFTLTNLSQAPYFNREAILQAAGLAEEDLLDVRLEGTAASGAVLPYFLSVDRARKEVILAIRGSLSMEDVVRDLCFEPADADEWAGECGSDGSGGSDDGSSSSAKGEIGVEWQVPPPALRPANAHTRYAAHSGILEAAKATLEDIQASGVLAEALMGPGARFPGYSLVVCGHSLGAGCAFLLALRLRRSFPGLRCFAFSPPGGLATAELCAGSTRWCTSVVCGKEMIPRLTLTTFERARDELVVCAVRCRRPKTHLAIGWLLGRSWTEAELFYPPDDVAPEPRAWLEAYQSSLAATASRREFVKMAGQFGPPGRVMWLKPTGWHKGEKKKKVMGCCGGGEGPPVRDYRAEWVEGQALVEQGVILSGRMMLDHFPDYCLVVLRRLAAAGGGGARARVSDAAGAAEVHRRVGGGGGAEERANGASSSSVHGARTS